MDKKKIIERLRDIITIPDVNITPQDSYIMQVRLMSLLYEIDFDPCHIKHDRVEPNEELTKLDIQSIALKWFLTANKHRIKFDLGWIEIFEAGYKAANLVNQQDAVKFAEWISENGFIQQPFSKIWNNIAVINHHSDDKLIELTTTELYQEYIKTLNK